MAVLGITSCPVALHMPRSATQQTRFGPNWARHGQQGIDVRLIARCYAAAHQPPALGEQRADDHLLVVRHPVFGFPEFTQAP